jgi:hypothetical protein
MRFNRILSVITAALLTLSITACGSTEPTSAETSSETSTELAAVTTAATSTAAETLSRDTPAGAAPSEGFIGDSIFPAVTIQDYIDLEMVEYIDLTADFQAYTPAMIETNDAIFEDVYTRIERYEELLEESGNNTENYIGGINVWAYSITDENFIQIYNTVFEYPTYGTAGDLFGYVYDIANDDYVTLDEFLEATDNTEDDLAFAMTEHYAAANPYVTFGTVDLKAFHLMKGPDGEYSYGFMFEMEVTPPEGDEPYKGFYMYTPFDGEVWEMNSDQLFDPYSVDQYDPPLHCNEGWEAYYDSITEYPTGEIDENYDPAYYIFEGDYYFAGDTAAAHFSFYGSDNVDAFYASGSYETSYKLQRLPDVEVTDEYGNTYNEISFDVFDADGNYAFMIKTTDQAPGSFEQYDKDGYFFAEYIYVD